MKNLFQKFSAAVAKIQSPKEADVFTLDINCQAQETRYEFYEGWQTHPSSTSNPA